MISSLTPTRLNGKRAAAINEPMAAGGVMAEMRTTMTQRGQVTVPAQIRKLLGLKAKDQVVWDVVDGAVVVRRPRFTLETLAGSVKLRRPIKDVDEAIRQAKEDKAAETVRKMREG
jgi:AbrB family looped-hinge helix DNA binding protein